MALMSTSGRVLSPSVWYVEFIARRWLSDILSRLLMSFVLNLVNMDSFRRDANAGRTTGSDVAVVLQWSEGRAEPIHGSRIFAHMIDNNCDVITILYFPSIDMFPDYP
jgi:hypothetical protein